MKNQSGQINILLIPLIFSVIFFFGAVGFGVWAYMERQDYKDHSDKKSASAVGVAVKKANSDKDNEFLEREKEPLKGYTGPESLGTISLKYPKTWSMFVDQNNDRGMTVLANRDIVTGGNEASQMLKIEVVQQAYDQVIRGYDSQVKNKKLTAVAYALPKMPKEVGMRFDGAITPSRQGAAVVLPLRDKTIKISTETTDGLKDFNGIILPNFQFQP